ncbi:MAG: hypothetical protein MI784_06700 [Cytophagales bacterium]|nr:hypothetical protein [Cytophagales bacterium]
MPFPPVLYLARILYSYLIARSKSVSYLFFKPESWQELEKEAGIPPIDFTKPGRLLDTEDPGLTEGLASFHIQEVAGTPFPSLRTTTPKPAQSTPFSPAGSSSESLSFRQRQVMRLLAKTQQRPVVVSETPQSEGAVNSAALRNRFFPSVEFDPDAVLSVSQPQKQGTQSFNFFLSMKSGETLVMKLLRESSWSSMPEKEAFASNFLKDMGVRIKGQKAWLLSRESSAFRRWARLVQENRIKGAEAVKEPLRQFMSTRIEHVLFMELAKGELSTSLFSRGFFSKEKSIASLSTGKAMGELIIFDLLLGNSDRILEFIMPWNLFIRKEKGGRKTEEWEAIDHLLSAPVLFRTLEKIQLIDFNQYPYTLKDMETIIKNPVERKQDLKNATEAIDKGITSFFREYVQVILQSKGGQIPFTQLIAERSSAFPDSPVRFLSSLPLDIGMVETMVRLTENKDTLEELSRMKFGSFMLEFNIFLRNWQRLIEQTEPRIQRLRNFLKNNP